MARKNPVRSTDWEADLGARVRRWRAHVGLKQSELEERAGLAHNAVSRVEKGEVSPRLETLERLAAALGISVEELQFRDPPSVESTRGDESREDLLRRIEGLESDDRQELLEILHSVLDLLERHR